MTATPSLATTLDTAPAVVSSSVSSRLLRPMSLVPVWAASMPAPEPVPL